MSIVQAHIDNHDYQLNDRIVCYFAFPRIGIAVALRPGDFLLFDPQEPHSISSRCKAEDEIFCASSYLKTAIVGLNDIQLTEFKSILNAHINSFTDDQGVKFNIYFLMID